MNAVIYCRVSTKDQAKNLSLRTQEKACREYCENQGKEVAKVFVEEGESAKTAQRPEFLKLLAYCSKHRDEIELLVVYSLSRFARDKYDHHAVHSSLKKLGISLRSVTEPIDDSSVGKLMEGVLASFAEFDNDVRAERTIEGMKEALAKGRWTHQAPLGYLRGVRERGEPSLVGDPACAHLVLQAFELCAAGTHTRAEVLNSVTDLGLRSRNGKRLSAQSLTRLLKNPLYAGWVVLRRWAIAERGDFEPLVGQELFEKVQLILGSGTQSPVRHLRRNPEFPLKRFVRCALCGRALTGDWSRGRSKLYAYYRCWNPSCRAVKLRKEALETCFLYALERLSVGDTYARLFRAVVRDAWKTRGASRKARERSLRREVASLEARRDRLEGAFLYDRSIDRETYARQQNQLGEQLARISGEKRQAESDEVDVEAVAEFAERILRDPVGSWRRFPTAAKLTLQELIFPQGLEFDGSGFRTAATSPIFGILQAAAAGDERVASPTGFEPAQTGDSEMIELGEEDRSVTGSNLTDDHHI